MPQEVVFNLVSPAKKSGGDKYQALNGDEFTIYFPQSISRPNGVPVQTIVATFNREK